jgi:hypothetical protein
LGCPVPIFHSSFFIMPFPADEFHAKGRNDRKAVPPPLGFPCPLPFFHFSFFIMPFPDGSIGRYSLFLPWRTLRPLRENIILQSTHCKQRGATFFFLLQGILF